MAGRCCSVEFGPMSISVLTPSIECLVLIRKNGRVASRRSAFSGNAKATRSHDHDHDNHRGWCKRRLRDSQKLGQVQRKPACEYDTPAIFHTASARGSYLGNMSHEYRHRDTQTEITIQHKRRQSTSKRSRATTILVHYHSTSPRAWV